MNNPTHAQSNREHEAEEVDVFLSLDPEIRHLVLRLIEKTRALAAALESAAADDEDES